MTMIEQMTAWDPSHKPLLFAPHTLLQKGPKSFLSQQITNNGLRL